MTEDNSGQGFSTTRGPKKKQRGISRWINYRTVIVVGLIGILLVGGFVYYQYTEKINKREEVIMKVGLYIPTLDVIFWGDITESGELIESENKYVTSEFYRGNIMVLYGGIFSYEDRNDIQIIVTYPNGTTLMIPEEYINFERVACYDLFLDEDCDIFEREYSGTYEIVWFWEESELEEPYGNYKFEIIHNQYEKSSVVKDSPRCCRSDINVKLIERRIDNRLN